jgi:hypothetical protein
MAIDISTPEGREKRREQFVAEAKKSGDSRSSMLTT